MKFDFISEFYSKVSSLKIDWEIKGLISNNKIFTLGSDSKLIGRIFELISAPLIYEIAEDNGYKVEIPEKQNTYPDFTLRKADGTGKLIAVDIKTTYRDYNKKGIVKKFGFTLGSYASFLRNGTKNIHEHYDRYKKHYIIGFIYDRSKTASEGVFSIEDYKKIVPPYSNVDFFVQEKYKIAGEQRGSGNTENIGSFKTNDVRKLINGEGPFSVLGEDVFEAYWREYPLYREENPKYDSIEGFLDWHSRNGKDVSILRKRYEEWKSMHEDD